jgi:DNA-binding response OmpR family regulator
MTERSVLIVDPWPRDVERLLLRLRREAIVSFGTTEVEEGLRLLERRRPRVLIVGLELDGAERLLDRACAYAGMRVIVTTRSSRMLPLAGDREFDDILLKDESFAHRVVERMWQFIAPESGANPLPRLLAVDDHRDTLELYSTYFSNRGYQILTSNSGEDAIRRLEHPRAIDVVLLDVLMPGVSGLDVLRFLMRQEFRPGVLMVSAIGDSETVVEAQKLGAHLYLVKPVDLPQLETAVESCLAVRT